MSGVTGADTGVPAAFEAASGRKFEVATGDGTGRGTDGGALGRVEVIDARETGHCPRVDSPGRGMYHLPKQPLDDPVTDGDVVHVGRIERPARRGPEVVELDRERCRHTRSSRLDNPAPTCSATVAEWVA